MRDGCTHRQCTVRTQRQHQTAGSQHAETRFVLVVLDHGSLNKLVTITTEDTKADPTKLGFRPGQQYRRGDLLHALMVKSYNDVALALARDTAGSVPRFVSMMNAKARSMGMRNSHFANPNGLPAPQYSTAVDMARCTWFAYRHPVLRSMVSTRSMEFLQRTDARSIWKTPTSSSHSTRGSPA